MDMNITINIEPSLVARIERCLTIAERILEQADPGKKTATHELPDGLPPPPEKFVFAGMDPLKNPPKRRSLDVLEWNEFGGWNDNDGQGWLGAVDGPWAVRIGSEIAKANGL
jgi:hypothetical protein